MELERLRLRASNVIFDDVGFWDVMGFPSSGPHGTFPIVVVLCQMSNPNIGVT